MMRILVTGGSGFIGTNLSDFLLEKGIEFINLDIRPPKRTIHAPYWQECDILDFDRTMMCFDEFQPTHVVHLAARTDTLSSLLEDYKVNTQGTEHVLNCIMATSAVERVIITSSQFVYGPPGDPKGDDDYKPVGAYGISKMISEKATRAAGLNCIWTITRPTNIWGPWHPRYPNEFWLVLKKGLYFHPGGKNTIRSYGYVGNLVYQMNRILEAPPDQVHGKVFYLGEPSIPLLNWVNGFALAITGRPARLIPRPLLKSIAAAGSMLDVIGIRFPITLSRYRSMTEDYFSPIGPTIEAFGIPPYTLDDGIRETVHWLHQYWDGNVS